MTSLIAGLAVFLGVHSLRIFADDWRTQRIARIGVATWKGLYAMASLLGIVLVAYGFGLSREAPVDLWFPPPWTRPLATLITLPIFVLLAAAYVPGTRIKAVVKHPMVLGVAIWAVAHLLSNGRLGEIVLFGGFLLWAILDFRSSRERDRKQGTTYTAVGVSRDFVAIAAGFGAWVAFAFYLHGALIRVPLVG